MVSYCCKEHKQEDLITHKEVCGNLCNMRKQSQVTMQVEIVWKQPQDDVLFLLVQQIKGPMGRAMGKMMSMMSGTIKRNNLKI